MKTKLTLFVAVLAVALFGMGCASTPETSLPLVKPETSLPLVKPETSPPLVKPETSPPLVKIEPAFVKEGLVAHYPFNGNAKDESGNGNDGNVKGAVLANDRHDKIDSSYSFDGKDDFIDLGNKPAFNFGRGDFAFSFWVRGFSLRNIYLIAKYKQNIKPGYGIGTWTGPPLAYAHIWDDNSKGYIHTYGGKSVSDGSWHHVSVVYDRDSALVIYVDGASVATLDISTRSGSVNNEFSLLIGKQSGGLNFKGSIDDVRIYNRALAEAEVKALYDLEKPKAE